MQKIKIIVRLPDNRDYTGRIHVENFAGKRLAGPFPICGRANDQMARDGKNSRRDPVLPFGDTPLGGYQIQKIIESGDKAGYSNEEFGPAGIILLQPVSGEAALAEANGRFGFFIQGGAMSRNGRLRPADGSLRLSNRDQRKLVSVLRSCEPIDCECEVLAGVAKKGRRVADVPARNVLAQARALLTGLLGTTTLEPAHRALLKKMLLAGRITVSIPSILMMSTPAFSQQTPVDKETGTLLASRDTSFSFPIMLAQADTGGSSQDYVGHLPNDTQANQQANTVVEHSEKAANSPNLENAKVESGIGFDTGGGQGTGGGSEPPPVSVVPEPGGDSQDQSGAPANTGESGFVGGNPNPSEENTTVNNTTVDRSSSTGSSFGTAAAAAAVGAVGGALIQHAISQPAIPPANQFSAPQVQETQPGGGVPPALLNQFPASDFKNWIADNVTCSVQPAANKYGISAGGNGDLLVTPSAFANNLPAVNANLSAFELGKVFWLKHTDEAGNATPKLLNLLNNQALIEDLRTVKYGDFGLDQLTSDSIDGPSQFGVIFRAALLNLQPANPADVNDWNVLRAQLLKIVNAGAAK